MMIKIMIVVVMVMIWVRGCYDNYGLDSSVFGGGDVKLMSAEVKVELTAVKRVKKLKFASEN